MGGKNENKRETGVKAVERGVADGLWMEGKEGVEMKLETGEMVFEEVFNETRK